VQPVGLEAQAVLLNEQGNPTEAMIAIHDVASSLMGFGEVLLMLARTGLALHDDVAAREAARRAVISLTASLGVDNESTKAAQALE
jgi:hypothetical protein